MFLNVAAWIERPQGPQEFESYGTSFRIEPPYDARTLKNQSVLLPREIGREEESKIGSHALSEGVPMWSEDQGSSLGNVMGNRFDLRSPVGRCEGHLENRD